MTKPVKLKLPATHDEWLDQRREGIGGSDAGAIVGLDPYKSPYTVWADKTGRLAPIEDNEAMREGRDFEDYVARRFMEATGKKVKKSGFSFRSADHPFMQANVDRLIVGENAGLECKTTKPFSNALYESGEIPPHYYMQCLHYLAVTGLDKWYIAILVYGTGFYWFEIDRDEDAIQSLIAKEEEFWNLVQSDTPPDPDASKACTEVLGKLYRYSNGETADLSDLDGEITIYESARRVRDLAQKDMNEVENRIKAALGASEKGRFSKAKVSWKTSTSKRFDQSRLKREKPEIYDAYKTKETVSRPFRLTIMEEGE